MADADTHWTLADLAAYRAGQRHVREGGSHQGGPSVPAPTVPHGNAALPLATQGHRYQSKTEARFALEVLEPWQHGSPSYQWWHEPFTIHLAPKVSYTPDFLALGEVGFPSEYTFYEVKGAWIRDRALIKPRMAARLFPRWRFVLAQWKGGQWQYTLLRSE